MNKNAKRVVLSGMAVIMMVSCGTAKKGGQSDTGVASKGDMEAIDNDYLILSDAQRDLLAKNNTFAINLFNKTNGMDFTGDLPAQRDRTYDNSGERGGRRHKTGNP